MRETTKTKCETCGGQPGHVPCPGCEMTSDGIDAVAVTLAVLGEMADDLFPMTDNISARQRCALLDAIDLIRTHVVEARQ